MGDDLAPNSIGGGEAVYEWDTNTRIWKGESRVRVVDRRRVWGHWLKWSKRRVNPFPMGLDDLARIQAGKAAEAGEEVYFDFSPSQADRVSECS